LNQTEKIIFDIICSKNNISIGEISKRLQKKNILPLIKTLYEKQAIIIEESMKSGFFPKKEWFVRLTEKANNEEFLNNLNLGKAKKQIGLLYEYIRLSGILEGKVIAEVKKKILLESTETTTAILNNLVKKGIFELYEQEVSRIDKPGIIEKEIPLLSEAQNAAFNSIKENFKKFNVVLLHGITSSGKTEIYMHLIKEFIDQGKQVLYLLPEIALTAQIINRLRLFFGNTVGIYHSKFSDNERAEVWHRINLINAEPYRLILGVRSSVFLPFTNLGLIIIDEEYESTYKQIEPAPRYHARDAAIMLARLHGAKVLLGTATPSIETYFNAKNGKYGLVELNERYKGVQLPEIRLINLKAARKNGRMILNFSTEMIESLEKTLNRSKQVILFQNRRGFAPYIQCSECNWIPHCKNCDITLTYHKFQNRLVCHYCGYTHEVYHKCNNCESNYLQTHGFGTEKIEEELAILFPSARIARMDLDSTHSKHAYENIISKFENKSLDILIGTQMVSKGLDFENVELVGIINADQMLNYPDFRAFERSFQHITQVSGRAGRKDKRGTVMIQTSLPEHPIIRYILKNDYLGMYEVQISERSQFKYPPICRLIQVTIKHKKIEICIDVANRLALETRYIFGDSVIGPDKPLIDRIQNLYLRNIFLKIDRNSPFAKIKFQLSAILTNIQQHNKQVIISVDVDPV